MKFWGQTQPIAVHLIPRTCEELEKQGYTIEHVIFIGIAQAPPSIANPNQPQTIPMMIVLTSIVADKRPDENKTFTVGGA